MTRDRHAVSALTFLVAVLAGCGGGSNPQSGGCTDPAKCPCTSDSTCADPAPRCDTRSGKCVPCLPTADNCAISEHCIFDGSKFTCVPKDSCASADDCAPMNGKPALCCNGKCADRFNDAGNCGTCGKVCDSVANANSGCVNGACGVTTCKAGFGDCDANVANGCEADVTNDVNRCGACDTPCKKAPNTTVSCAASKCAAECLKDFADCDGNAVNGCETSTITNSKNCGGCGKTCPPLPNSATVACSMGACVVESCTGSFADCNHLPNDGCEADVRSDANNCNACGKKCPVVQNGAPGCSMGSCGVGKCDAGYGDCDGNVLNGCELDLTADPKNCGSCGTVCAAPNGIFTCNAGMCQLQACNQGFADCDNNPANGCEAVTSRDLNNCGACGVVCPVPANATASCSFGVCGVGSCKYGWGDCNKNLNDGCEVDLLQVSNCGACGVVCPNLANAMTSCKTGMCTIGMCNAGFIDCDMKLANGCEINAVSDANNCGGCGVVCTSQKNQAMSCVNGKCAVTGCLQGYSDCNNNQNDGCEAQTDSDAKNCGACAKVCPQNLPTCAKGVCVPTLDYGPVHSFTGLTATHYITQGGCGVNNQQVLDDNARYFCERFYGQPLGKTCLPVPGYIADRLVNCADSKMHKNGGCTGNGNNVPNTTCDNGPCKIGNWNECTSGVANIICRCQ